VRAYNCLKRAGIAKVGEVLERLEKGEDEILAIRNFGRKSLDELLEKLAEKGFLAAISTSSISGSALTEEDSGLEPEPEPEHAPELEAEDVSAGEDQDAGDAGSVGEDVSED